MTLDKAIKALQFNTEWKVILDALCKDREALINDFHSPTQPPPQSIVKNWLTFRLDTSIYDWLDEDTVVRLTRVSLRLFRRA
jgi:hypothetical protein